MVYMDTLYPCRHISGLYTLTEHGIHCYTKTAIVNMDTMYTWAIHSDSIVQSMVYLSTPVVYMDTMHAGIYLCYIRTLLSMVRAAERLKGAQSARSAAKIF